jgi:Integrase core domain
MMCSFAGMVPFEPEDSPPTHPFHAISTIGDYPHDSLSETLPGDTIPSHSACALQVHCRRSRLRRKRTRFFSRLVVDWAMDAHRDEVLVEQAARLALAQRHPEPGLLHHSDRGSQYTAADYLELLGVA